MVDILERLAATEKERIKAIAHELAQYGLGVFEPHFHDDDGNIIRLPEGIVSYERDLNVRFIPRENLPLGSRAVGWRWSNGDLDDCAHCCAIPPPPE